MFGRIAGLALALVLLLAGCSDEARPDDAPTLTSATPSVSASPTSSVDFAALARQTVLDYYAEATRAASSGQAERLQGMSLPDCSCRRLVKYIQDKWRAGSLRGVKFAVKQLDLLGAEPDHADFRMLYAQSPYSVLDRSGTVVENVPYMEATVVVTLARDGSRYLFANVVTT